MRMMIIIVLFAVLMLPGKLLASPPLAVQGLSARVQLDGSAYALSPLIGKRMQASVLTIAEHVLVGHSLAEVQGKKQEYEMFIQEVFDRILIGYTVKSVSLTIGEQTEIAVQVIPWQDIIQQVDLEIDVAQMPEEIKTLVKQDIGGVQQIFEQVLLGLPIDAVEWTSGVTKTSLQEFLAVHLPEFRGDFEVVAGEKAKVRLALYPKGDVIRNIDLSLRSKSMPNLILLSYRPAIQHQTDILLGVPIAFIERHKNYFTQRFTAQLAADQKLKKFGVDMVIHMDVGAKTTVAIQADTDKYQISVEGYLDIGRREDNTSFRLHAGKYISPVDELYLEADFFPQEVEWIFMPGLSRRITPQMTVGFKYDLDQQHSVLWAKQRIGDKWLLRFEHTPKENFNEFGVRYELHDFVGLEYVINDDDHWLRMVGNF